MSSDGTVQTCECYECIGPEYEYTDDGHRYIVNNVKEHTYLEPCESCVSPKTEYRDLGRKGYYVCWRCNSHSHETEGDQWTTGVDHIHEEPDQEWRNHLEEERDWLCPKHGYVSPTKRQHGGRARAFVCPKEGCRRTVKSTNVDWDAYHEARENGENPPCPECGSTEIGTVPAKPTFRCEDCSHAFGYAGGYY